MSTVIANRIDKLHFMEFFEPNPINMLPQSMHKSALRNVIAN